MIAAIIPAAGISRRMGRPKLLLPYGDDTIIARVVRSALDSQAVGEVIVVVGNHNRDDIAAALASHAVTLAINECPENGMLASIRSALASVSPTAEAAMILPGDQPEISTGVIDQLAAFYHSRRESIAVTAYEGKRGHPLLFSMNHATEVMRRFDDRGLRGLLEAHPEEVALLDTGEASVLEDIDTPADYEQALARMSGGDCA